MTRAFENASNKRDGERERESLMAKFACEEFRMHAWDGAPYAISVIGGRTVTSRRDALHAADATVYRMSDPFADDLASIMPDDSGRILVSFKFRAGMFWMWPSGRRALRPKGILAAETPERLALLRERRLLRGTSLGYTPAYHSRARRPGHVHVGTYGPELPLHDSDRQDASFCSPPDLEARQAWLLRPLAWSFCARSPGRSTNRQMLGGPRLAGYVRIPRSAYVVRASHRPDLWEEAAPQRLTVVDRDFNRCPYYTLRARLPLAPPPAGPVVAALGLHTLLPWPLAPLVFEYSFSLAPASLEYIKEDPWSVSAR